MSEKFADEASRAAPQGAAPSAIESVSEAVCMLLLTIMVVMTSVEVLARALFEYSLQATDELSSYFLLAIAFLSFGVSLVHRRLAEVDFVMQRLGPKGRRWLQASFDLMAIIFVTLLVWQFWRLTLGTWESDQRAATHLGTPLWIPRLAMLAGAVTLLIALCRDCYIRFTSRYPDGEAR